MSLSCTLPGSSPPMLPERKLGDTDGSRTVERSSVYCSERPRANEVLEARGAPVARKGDSARAGGAAAEMLLPLKWADVALVSSRLPFRRRGKRVKVRRRLLVRVAGDSGCEAVVATASDTALRASRSNRSCGSSVSGPMSGVSPEWEESEEENEAAETVRGRNGVVKGIAVRGRMVAESRRRLTKGERVGTLARIGRPLVSHWGVRDRSVCVYHTALLRQLRRRRPWARARSSDKGTRPLDRSVP